MTLYFMSARLRLPAYVRSHINFFGPKSDLADGLCWEWTGNRNKTTGYGRAWIDRKEFLAHRLVWALLVGEIPAGLTLDHICRNRGCVNPKHLELVTRGVNVLRGIGPSAMNARKTHCRRGHEFTPGNTYIYRQRGRLQRHCKACWTVRNREHGHQPRSRRD